MNWPRNLATNTSAAWLLLTAVIVAGSALRMIGAFELIWLPSSEHSAGGVLRVHDGYHYLEKAREIYESIPSGSLPDLLARPFYMPAQYPLISTLAAIVSWVTLAPLEWVGVFMPAIVASLLAIPVFLTGRNLGGVSFGLVAAMASLLHPSYLARASAGCFDTDILNVTFYTLISCAGVWLLKGGVVKAWPRLFLMAGMVFIAHVNWPNAGRATFLFGLSTLVCSVMPGIFAWLKSTSRTTRGTILVLVVFGLFIVCLTPIRDYLADPFRQLWFVFTHKAGDSHALMVPENRLVTFAELVQYSKYDSVLFVAAFLPGLWLFVARPVQAAPLLPLLLLGILGIRSVRFLEFMAPLMGLGIAGIIYRSRSGSMPWFRVGIAVSLMLFCLLFIGALRMPNKPVVRPIDAQALTLLSKRLPANAVLWPHWNMGYAVQYYARRPALFHGGMIRDFNADCNAIPFAARNDQAASGFVRWYEGIGEHEARITVAWLKRLGLEPFTFILDLFGRPRPEGERWLADKLPGVDKAELVKRFYPDSRRTVYLVMDASMQTIMESWHSPGVGPFEPNDSSGEGIRRYDDLSMTGKEIIGRSSAVNVDLQRGVLISGDSGTWLDKIYFLEAGKSIRYMDFARPRAPSFLAFSAAGEGWLLTDYVVNNLYCRAFLLRNPVFSMRAMPVPASSFLLLGATPAPYSRDQIERISARAAKRDMLEPDSKTWQNFRPWPKSPLRDEFRDVRKLAIVGDSISAYAKTGEPSRYWQVLERRLEQEVYGEAIHVENYSVSGARLSDISSLLRSWRSQDADLIILALGMNDLADLAAGKSFQSWEQDFKRALDALSNKTSSPIVLLAPAPTPSYWNLHYKDQDRVVNVMREEAERRGVLFADAFGLFRQVLRDCWFSDLMVDAINHPNDKGHYLYAIAIRDALSKGTKTEP